MQLTNQNVKLEDRKEEKAMEKGAKGNPFFKLNFSFEKGILRLDPYPILNEDLELGPRFNLKEIWPSFGVFSGPPTMFLITDVDPPLPFLTYKRKDVIELALQAEQECSLCTTDMSFALNAYLIGFPVWGEKIWPVFKEEMKKRTFDGGRPTVIAVQFFHIDAEPPKEMREAVKIMKQLGIT